MAWQGNLKVVLVQSRNSLNIGAAARAMFNFGFSELWLVDPYDAAFRKARSAVGAGEVLRKARVTSDLAEALGEASLIVGASGVEGRVQRQVRRAFARRRARVANPSRRPAGRRWCSARKSPVCRTNNSAIATGCSISRPRDDCPSIESGAGGWRCAAMKSREWHRRFPRLEDPGFDQRGRAGHDPEAIDARP